VRFCSLHISSLFLFQHSVKKVATRERSVEVIEKRIQHWSMEKSSKGFPV